MADSLEADWNDALRQLGAAQEDYERQSAGARTALGEQATARIRALASDFPALWSSPATPQRERKRMIRLVIEDVTLARTDRIHLHVRFRGGQTQSLELAIPAPAWKTRQTHPDTLALLDRLLDSHTDAEVAQRLNADGHRSGTGKPFTTKIVLRLRRAHSLPTHAERLRAKGLLTLAEIAERLGVHPGTIAAWQHAGLLTSHKANDKSERLYDLPAAGDPRLVKCMGRRLDRRELPGSSPGGAV